MALIDEEKMRSDFDDWFNDLSGMREVVIRVRDRLPPEDEPNEADNISVLNVVANTLNRIIREMNEVSGDLTSNAQSFEVLKNEAAYKGAIVDAWPRDIFADRLTYFGTALLGVGSGTFILLGAPISLVLLAPMILWATGFVLLGWGLTGVREREAHRWDFFKTEFKLSDRKKTKSKSG